MNTLTVNQSTTMNTLTVNQSTSTNTLAVNTSISMMNNQSPFVAISSSNFIGGVGPPSFGRVWPCIPCIKTDGVMEVGWIIDFHWDTGEQRDFYWRFQANQHFTFRGAGGGDVANISHL